MLRMALNLDKSFPPAKKGEGRIGVFYYEILTFYKQSNSYPLYLY